MSKENLSIIDIAPVGTPKLNERPNRNSPVYLVVIEDATAKTKFTKFLAAKLDETATVVRIIGIEVLGADQKINDNYQGILNSTDKSLYKEFMLPWQRIIKIQNLIFKQK